MPRPKNKKSAEEKAHERERSRLLSDFWDDRITAGKEVKLPYSTTRQEVLEFFKSKHEKFYAGEAQNFMGFDGSGFVSVPKVAQMKGSIGPRLSVTAPTCTVIPRSPDPVLIGWSRGVGAYLTHTRKEANFGRNLRKTVDDGLMGGRMFMRQVWDEVRKIVTSTYLSSMDIVFDPDFTDIQDAAWIAIRHREPLWQLERRLPKWRLRGLCSKDRLEDGGVIGADPKEPKEEDNEDDVSTVRKSTSTLVEWWEILSKMGCGFRGTGLAAHKKKYDDKNDFVRICIVQGHDCVLEEGEWDVPLYLDREWPISWGDMVETPDTPWPESPMGQVLPLQKAIDLLTSLRLSSCKNRDRVVVFVDKEVSGEVQQTLRTGTAADIVPVKVKSGHSLESVMKIADFGKGAQESALERDFLMKELEVTLGTTSLVTGGQDAQAKDRSATATQLRNSAAEIRTADLENRVSELMTDAARKEAIMIRLFVSEEDFIPFVKTSDINMFYLDIPLDGGESIPVRPIKIEGDDTLTLKDIYPGASTYFETPEAAAQAAILLWQELQITTDTRLIPLRNKLKAEIDPMTGFPPIHKWVVPVDGKRIYRDTAGLTAEEIMRELAFDIEAGKGVKFDNVAERQNTDMLLQTLLPTMLQMGDIEGANAMLNMRHDAYKVPKDKRVQLKGPPPGQQGQQGSGQGEGEKGEKKPPSKGKKEKKSA